MRKKKLIREVLDNGLTILVQEKPNIGSVSCGVGVRFGTAYHPTAHFLEHAIFKGTETRDYAQIYETVKRWGGYLDGFTQFYSTLFAGKTLSPYACSLLDILCDIVANPAFTQEEIDLERQVLGHEINMIQKNPEMVLKAALYRALFKKHPIRNVIPEDIEPIRAINREDLLQTYRQFYVPERLIVVIVGNIKLKGVFAKIEKYFGDLPQGIAAPPSVPQEEPIEKAQEIHLDSGTNNECRWMLGFRAPHYTHEDYYAARVASALLGGGINSALFREIRGKRGLTYNIESHYGPPEIPWGSRFLDDCSAWHGTFRMCSQFSSDDLSLVQTITQQEFGKLVSQEVSETELKNKQTMLAGQRLLALEGTLCNMWLLFTAEVNGNLADFKDYEKNIFAVDLDDIKRVAEKYLTFDKSAQIIMKRE